MRVSHNGALYKSSFLYLIKNELVLYAITYHPFVIVLSGLVLNLFDTFGFSINLFVWFVQQTKLTSCRFLIARWLHSHSHSFSLAVARIWDWNIRIMLNVNNEDFPSRLKKGSGDTVNFLGFLSWNCTFLCIWDTLKIIMTYSTQFHYRLNLV